MLKSDQNNKKTTKKAKSETFFGYKGVSPLLMLPMFDMSTGPIIDYMHTISVVVKQTIGLIFRNLSAIEFEEIERKYSQIRTISDMPRYIRSLTETAQYKSSEWINLLLLYFSPIIREASSIEREKRNHFFKFSSAIYIFLKKNILTAEIKKAEKLLEDFVLSLRIQLQINF